MDQRTCRSCDFHQSEKRTKAGLQISCDYEHRWLPIRSATECRSYRYAPGVDEPWDDDYSDAEGMV